MTRTVNVFATTTTKSSRGSSGGAGASLEKWPLSRPFVGMGGDGLEPPTSCL